MKKNLTNCISLALFLILLIGMVCLLDYLLVPMSRADFFLHDMKRMKRKGPNIDLILIGNSRYLYGLNPQVFEEVAGFENAYNASVTGLPLSSNYYITESMINYFQPKAIVFDVNWRTLLDRGLDMTQSKLLGLDRLNWPSKIRHIANDFYPSEMIYGLIRPYRYRDRLFWEGYIAENVRLKRWAESTKYEIDYYQTIKGYDKGMSCAAGPYNMADQGRFDKSLIDQHNLQYLDKLVELCKSRNISLFLMTMPVSTMEHMNTGNYQESVDVYTNYAREKGVFYFDMNMLKNRDEIFTDNLFSDARHCCDEGADLVSKICAEIIRDEMKGLDTGDRFYSSMEQLSEDITRVVAVGADVDSSQDTIFVNNLRATAGKDADISFDVQFSTDGEKYETVARAKAVGTSVEITPEEKSHDNKYYIKIKGTNLINNSETFANYTIEMKKK